MGFNEFLKARFSATTTRDRKEIQPWVENIKAAYPEVAKLDNDALRAKTEELKVTSTIRQPNNAQSGRTGKPALKIPNWKNAKTSSTKSTKIEERFRKGTKYYPPTFSIVKETAKTIL